MFATRAKSTAKQIHFSDGNILFTPETMDLFVLSAERTIEACTAAVEDKEMFTRVTDTLFKPLAKWCRENSDLVSGCYVDLPRSKVVPVYMVGVGKEYDFDLTESLCRLSESFEEAGWSIHASQVPSCDPDELRGYFDFDNATRIF